MNNSSPSQPHFPAIAGFPIHVGFNGGALSSDFAALLLRGTNVQIGLIPSLAGAIDALAAGPPVDFAISYCCCHPPHYQHKQIIYL